MKYLPYLFLPALLMLASCRKDTPQSGHSFHDPASYRDAAGIYSGICYDVYVTVGGSDTLPGIPFTVKLLVVDTGIIRF